MTDKLRVAVLISGRGSNMEALIDAARDPAYPAKIVLVLANRPDAKGLETAAAAGIEAIAVDHKPFGKDREAHERAIDALLRERGVELIALAGYMRVLTPFLVKAWAGRMLNIHPSLLPKYPFLKVAKNRTNMGKTEAILTGLACSTGKFVAVLDADLQYSPEDIPRLMEKLYEGYDLVTGWKVGKYSKRFLPEIQ